jgi:hypothetical protein
MESGGEDDMQMIRTKMAYGFLILAFGLLLTDVCRLAWSPSNAAAHQITMARGPSGL